MSMLAERKNKEKWSLNPRGKAWLDDSNNFGKKMLEKMGWSKGKGLGAKEDGIVEHVKVSYKNDLKGMGFKETNDQWTLHDIQFNALLQSLSSHQPNHINQASKPFSLEEKSLNSKVRVHYKKFTRGKDLTRYSDKDLANIFGKKRLLQQLFDGNDEPKLKLSENEDIYPKRKLENGDGPILRRKKVKENDMSIELHQLSTIEEEDETKPVFCDNNRFEVKRKKNKILVSEEPLVTKVDKKKKKIKPRILETEGTSNLNFLEDEIDEQNPIDNNIFEVKRVKKERSKKKTDSNLDSTEKKEKLNHTQKKKSKLTNSEGVCNEIFTENGEELEEAVHDNNQCEIKRTTKSKKFQSVNRILPSQIAEKEDDINKNETCFDNPNLELNDTNFDLILNVTSTPKTFDESSIVKKKNRRKNVETVQRNELFDINSRVIENGLRSVEEFSKEIDCFQIDIENDMNEAKLKNGDGVLLKYDNKIKSINTPHYSTKTSSLAKKSYKHLIKGDIVVCFRNTNLSDIAGYGVKKF